MDSSGNGREDATPAGTESLERSFGGLLADLARDLSRLVRQEMALARAEIVDKFGELGIGAGLVAVAGALAFAGLLYLMAAAMIGLAMVVPLWAAALIVGGVALLIAGALAMVGRAKMRANNLVPARTIKTLRDDAVWAREQMR